MKLCKYNCIPCCDFCIYAIHEKIEYQGKIINGGPEGCSLHKDEKHQDIANNCGHCPDFHCYRADEK